MADIRVLDKHVAELIAAGEVVERPASIVKELLENAVDAGATVVTIEADHGGVTRLSVCDNGCGIPADQVPTAFLRHATSKVQTVEDLDAIGTLGFRGEALASIAAVARVEMVTRVKDALEGTYYRIDGGETVASEPIGCAAGTILTVKDLFFNVPARMKFLKKDVGEANAIAGVVDRIALSHPEISFRFVRDGQQTLLTPGNGDLHACIYAVFGREFTEGLAAVDYTLNGVRVHGFVCRPSAARANRAMQHFFVNGRYVKTRTAAAALEQAFKGRLMVGRFPSCVLFVELNPAAVDVNVHPAKIEVRFINEKPVFDAVFYGVRNTLEGKPAPAAPKPSVAPKPPVAPPAPQMRFAMTPPASPAPSPSSVPIAVTPVSPRIVPLHDNSSMRMPDRPVTMSPPAAKAPEEKTPAAPEPVIRETPEKPPVRLIGEVFDTYILAQMGDSIFVIDKHAAHERILYNQLCRDPHAEAQQLLAPAAVSLSKEEATVLLEHRDDLAESGFELDDFGDGTVLVRAVPMMLSDREIPSMMQEIAGGFLSGKNSVYVERREWIYHSVACRAAIKAGDKSSPAEAEALARQVLEDDSIRYCPHGRPVCIEWTRQEWEKKFGRA